ncbi:hypothetical protein [Massilia endophytica]|uniref:hypothetical protein n=1 Tax=Massilia endophytica TaxID=2899220 RepID=UPI001E340810|nr:hypothetical protein [Massilia endophytica]UGQ45795.1 hypothetical protein LSQ66_18690 [Massilia endophytica]
MDQHKLRSLVFEKTGVKVDVDDPIFALVALNEAVLADAVERHIAQIDAASQELTALARQAGGLPQPGRGSSEFEESEPARPAGFHPAPAATVKPIATQHPLFTPRELRLMAVSAGLSLLAALLVVGLQAMFSKPAPAPVVQTTALSSEQIAAIATGEKYNKILPRLDPKTRAALQAEMAKP